MTRRFLMGLVLSFLAFSVAPAQDEPEPLRLEGLMPSGGRTSVTEAWSTLRFTIENRGPTARDARVVVFYPERRDVQFGRDVWVPGRSRVTSWISIGPAPPYPSELRRDFSYMFFDRTGGVVRPLSPTEPEKIPTRAVAYRKREPTTAIVVDAVEGEADDPDPLASPDSPTSQSVLLTRTFRHARGLSENVSLILGRELPPTPEALDGIDHLVLAGNRLAADPAGRQAMRHWLLKGGTIWVMLDRVDTDVIAPILGDGLRFRVVDRTSLTNLRLRSVTEDPAQVEPREFDYPVDLVRVLLSGTETLLLEVNGWPAAFSQSVGRGRVIFTTLGGRGWYRDRTPRDPPSQFEHFKDLPIPLGALDSLAWRIHPEIEPAAFQTEDLGPLLSAEIGYKVLGRSSAAAILGGFVIALLALGLWLRRSRSPELIGVIGPVAAVVAASVFVLAGTVSRRAVPSTAASAAVVEFAPETGEASARGMFAVYSPESGVIQLGAEHGGDVDLDQSGLEGQTRKRIQTDLDKWHWEDLTFPAGVRMGPFHSTITARASAAGRFGSGGLEGRLDVGTFQNPADAVLLTRSGTVLATHLNPDGTFSVGPESDLPTDQYLPGSVLTDRQQRRQNVYRKLMAQPRPPHLSGQDRLLVWAETSEVPFTSGDPARKFGAALLVVPLELERARSDESVTIPSGFCSFTAVTEGRSHRPTLEGTTAVRNRLRFQLPPSVLPFEPTKATLIARVRAQGRTVTVSGIANGKPVVLHEARNPLGTVRVEITDPAALGLDPSGGLHLEIAVSGLGSSDGGGSSARTLEPEARWQVEAIGLEVSGRVKSK